MKKYHFFEHKDCEFYPCHASQEINCMFCYCPAYRFVQCPGNPQWLDNGIKDCSSCLFPHIKSHYQQMMDFLSLQNQVVRVNNPKKIAHFFQDNQNTMIQSYLDGYLGEAYVDNSHHAQSAMILIGDFCFLAGKCNQALLKSICRQFVIVVYQNQEWKTFIENLYGSKVKIHTRYATKKELSHFHSDEFKHNIQLLDSNYTLTAINEPIYKQLLLEDWSKDLVSNYSSFEEFSQYGMGFVITKDNIMISGASAYSYYNGGIDIEVDTHPKYRRQSFAFIVASKLILTCLEKGLYPNWDAHSIESLHLAEKLGYQLDKAYTVSLINLL